MAKDSNTATESKPLTAKQQAFLSAYLSDSGRNATRAAESAGYKHPREQGARLLSNVHVQYHIDEWRAEVKESAISSIEKRLEVLNDLKGRLLAVIHEREVAAESDPDAAPGARTGMMARTEKMLGHGEFAERVVEWKYDQSIVESIQNLDAQAAKELGQWSDRVDLSGSMTQTVQIIGVDPEAI